MGQQLFGTQHIIYLVISFALMGIGWFACIKKLDTAEKQDKFVRYSAIGLILFLCLNRGLIHYYLARPFLPQSWCAVTGLMGAVCLILEKRKGYFGFYFIPNLILSGLIPTFAGDYLNEGYTFGWDTILFPPTFTSLIYHSFMFFLGVLCIIFKYVDFNPKKWFMVPVCYGIEMVYGLIYLQIYPDGYTDAIGKTLNVMNINTPVLGIFSAWRVFLLMMLAEAIYIPIMIVVNKKMASRNLSNK